jgi:hypothetical protein
MSQRRKELRESEIHWKEAQSSIDNAIANLKNSKDSTITMLTFLRLAQENLTMAIIHASATTFLDSL